MICSKIRRLSKRTRGLSKPYFQTLSAFSLRQLRHCQSLAYQKLHSDIPSSALNDSPTCSRSSLPSDRWKHCDVDLPHIIQPPSSFKHIRVDSDLPEEYSPPHLFIPTSIHSNWNEPLLHNSLEKKNVCNAIINKVISHLFPSHTLLKKKDFHGSTDEGHFKIQSQWETQ